MSNLIVVWLFNWKSSLLSKCTSAPYGVTQKSHNFFFLLFWKEMGKWHLNNTASDGSFPFQATSRTWLPSWMKGKFFFSHPLLSGIIQTCHFPISFWNKRMSWQFWLTRVFICSCKVMENWCLYPTFCSTFWTVWAV